MKSLLIVLLLCSFLSTASIASDTATQTITITIDPIAIIGFRDSNSTQAYLTVATDGEIQTVQKELGLTTTLSGLSLYAEITEEPENPSYSIEILSQALSVKGIVGNSFGWALVGTEKPAKIIAGIGPACGFYSIDYRANKIKESEEVESYTITFTLTDE
jgi:hypothetical protein